MKEEEDKGIRVLELYGQNGEKVLNMVFDLNYNTDLKLDMPCHIGLKRIVIKKFEEK